MTPDRHSKRARRALIHLAEIDPAAAALALWCQHRDGEGRTYTQGETIWYGSEFDTLPLPEAVGLAAHHILHVALRHSARRADMALRQGTAFDAELYDLVGDALLNDLLLSGGHALPRPAVRASELLSVTFGRPVDPAETLRDWDTERLYVSLLRGGSGTDQSVERSRAYARSKGFEQDVYPEDGADRNEESPQEWQGRLRRAMEVGRQAGTGVGSVGATLIDLPRPTVPWEVHLRRLMSRSVLRAPRTTFERPANRWIAADAEARLLGRRQPAFQPGARRDTQLPRIVVALDTSGSISRHTLEIFAAEAIGLQRRLQCELHFFAFDSEVNERHSPIVEDLRSVLAKSRLPEGGGTNFEPVLREATALAPSATVILTDLEGPIETGPDHPVVWVSDVRPNSMPPFGTLLVADS